MRRSPSLVCLTLLALICVGCAHYPVTGRQATTSMRAKPAATATKPDVFKAGEFGDADSTQKPANPPLPTGQSGTARDNYSDVASQTPDGGKSATTSVAKATAAGTPALEGGDIPGVGTDKGPNDTAAASATAEKTGLDQTGHGKADAAASQGTVAGARSKPSGANKPVNGSDPAIIGPPSVGRRSRV